MTEEYFSKEDAKALEKLLCLKIKALAEKGQVINELNQLAIDKAVVTLNERMEMMNEFRAQMKDQQNTYITRPELEAYNVRIKSLELDRAKLEGKASQTSFLISLAMSMLGIILSVIGMLK